MGEKATFGTRQMVLVQDKEGNVFKVFADAIPPVAAVEVDEKELVLIQDPRSEVVFKAFKLDIPKLAEVNPELMIATWKDTWKDVKGALPVPPFHDRWGDDFSAVVQQVAEFPTLESYLKEQPDLKFVPIKEFG